MTGALCLLCLSAGAAGEDLDIYRVTQTSHTSTRDESGNVRSMDVVTDSTISVKEQITEKYVADKYGNLELDSRSTLTQYSDGRSVTVTEQRIPDYGGLAVMSVTTVGKKSDGSNVTTVETRNAGGQIEIARRVTLRQEADGSQVTITEERGSDGRLFVAQTITRKN